MQLFTENKISTGNKRVHSGLRMSHRPFIDVDPQGWDSGKVGVIYALKSDVIQKFGSLSDDALQLTREMLIEEISDYDDFLCGNYYQYIIEGLEGEHLDSCSSFTGDCMQDILKDMKLCAGKTYAFLFDKLLNKEKNLERY